METKKANRLPPEIKLVTYPQLYATLAPIVGHYPWGLSTIRDLWLQGAPVPQDRCPGNKPCKAYPRCDHIRRAIGLEQFQKWFAEVHQRAKSEASAQDVFRNIKARSW